MTSSHRLDSGQQKVAVALRELARNLTAEPAGFWAKLFKTVPAGTKGLYIWGNVGRGKTMLMDQFFAGVVGISKRRVHFHAFMQDVHRLRASKKSDDVIGEIADGISRDRLLCLDEMQISDIADAMIIGRLFEALRERGVVVVTTSNSPPDELYKDGLNRQLFLPFIAKLKTELEVVHLEDGVDYRLGRIAEQKTYLSPLNKETNRAFEKFWQDLTDNTATPIEIDVIGRKLPVPRAGHGCARFSFSNLCEAARGAPDFLAIAKAFKTVFLSDVPVIKASQRNEAKRFILLIDTLYDAGTRLVVSAAAEPEQLLTGGTHAREFQRTASRLREMQSQSWWKKDS